MMLTIAEKARLASMCAFWIFVQEITMEEKPEIPIHPEIDDILADVLYAARACASAFENKGERVHLLHAWLELISFSHTSQKMV